MLELNIICEEGHSGRKLPCGLRVTRHLLCMLILAYNSICKSSWGFVTSPSIHHAYYQSHLPEMHVFYCQPSIQNSSRIPGLEEEVHLQSPYWVTSPLHPLSPSLLSPLRLLCTSQDPSLFLHPHLSLSRELFQGSFSDCGKS